MVPFSVLESTRRERPRVSVQAFCSEYTGDLSRHALIVDLSEDGLRLQRPVPTRFGGRTLQLEFEIPEVDEIMWARGQICFDHIWQLRQPASSGLSGVLRTSGVRIVSAASRHRRLLREYVHDFLRSRESNPLARASCYSRG